MGVCYIWGMEGKKYTGIFRSGTQNIEKERQEKHDLEIELAKSNIKANELNEENAVFNRKHTKINTWITVIAILLSLLNLVLIISESISSE